ncbi:MAG: thiamine pyrophosphate-binding protein [Oscillospiraceae bacterium]|jgi:acetolactate synthase-1/2/3 large subunit|nr:thiamine pyrophosphate-binding protein [Oscillospiraceae bacterium]
MKIKVAHYIANFLVERGVKHIFTLTGGGAMHLNDAFGHHSGITCIYNHHEQACAIAAEGYTRLTGKLAAVCVTSGPGGTNAITGVLGGWLDSIPMFVISGQVKRETTIHAAGVPLRQLGDQEFDIVSCVSGMTKYACIVMEPGEIRYHMEKAWFLATNGRSGPVWLDIPLDVQAAIVETGELKGFDEKECAAENPVYDKTLSLQIIERIKTARRPALFAGSGINLANAKEMFVELAEALQIPVVTAFNGLDVMWENHPLYCGRPGTIGLRGGNFVVQNSDLLLVLGCRLNIRQISYNYKSFAEHAYKIIVDIDKNELQKPTVTPDLPVWANIKDVITDLLRHDLSVVHSETHNRWLQWSKRIHNKYPAVLPAYYEKQEPLNPYVFIHEFFKKLSDDEVVVCGNGSACVITFQAAILKRNQRLFTNSGCAAMGYGFPAAIGCCFARKGERVICIDGDGSFQMNLQELQTVAHHRLNLKIIYINNAGYHSIRQTQTNLFQPPLVGVSGDTGVSFPCAENIANAYNIPFMRVISVADVEKLHDFIAGAGTAFCEIVVDPLQNFEPKLSSKVLPDGSIVSPQIDDMFPFLDKEEYAANKNINDL